MWILLFMAIWVDNLNNSSSQTDSVSHFRNGIIPVGLIPNNIGYCSNGFCDSVVLKMQLSDWLKYVACFSSLKLIEINDYFFNLIKFYKKHRIMVEWVKGLHISFLFLSLKLHPIYCIYQYRSLYSPKFKANLTIVIHTISIFP